MTSGERSRRGPGTEPGSGLPGTGQGGGRQAPGGGRSFTPGKTALWAGAMDTRFGLVISNDSARAARPSAGGASARPSRSEPQVPALFCGNYKRYSGRKTGSRSIRTCCWRSSHRGRCNVASAEDDQWADPKGEFLGAVAASDVYELLGRKGLGTKQMPPVNQPVGDTVRYHVRTASTTSRRTTGSSTWTSRTGTPDSAVIRTTDGC